MEHIFKDQIIVNKASVGVDRWGNPIVVSPLSYRCRINEESKSITDDNGEEVVSQAEIRFIGLVTINYQDELEWVDSMGINQKNEPKKVLTVKDTHRVRMTVVYV